MSANSNMLFVMLNGKADALGDLSATNTSNTTFAGAGMRCCGLCGGYGCRQRGRPQQRHTRTRRPPGLRTADL